MADSSASAVPGVRLAWPKDAMSITTVQRRSWRRDWPEALAVDAVFGSQGEHGARWLTTLTSSPDARFRVLVATVDDSVIGYAVVHAGADPDADPTSDAELGDLVVDPDARRAGHGTRLVQAVVDTAVADHFTTARAWLRADDEAALALLTSGGWALDQARRELEAPDGNRIRQVRLHTQIT